MFSRAMKFEILSFNFLTFQKQIFEEVRYSIGLLDISPSKID